MKDLTYSHIDKLSQLNTILLNELTISCSNLDKSKFLNSILLTELKYSIESEANFEIIETEIPILPTVDQDLNIVTMDKEPDQREIQIIDIFENDEILDSKSKKVSIKFNDYAEETISKSNNQDLEINIIQEEKQILNQSQEHVNIAIVNEGQKEKLCSSSEKASTEFDHSSNNVGPHKCDICHKTIISKEMKMDMKKVHHMGKDVTLVTCHNCNKKIMSTLFNCASCSKSFSHKGSLKMHIKRYHSSDGIKCDSVDPNLKISVHKTDKNHKCDSCGKSFSLEDTLKTHINRVHEGVKTIKHQSQM